ncbi:cytoplasmic tRNA 2-thiolation protein 2 [Calliphora vicina]|uniref:cytoplasmic tRNA 2-thiolation protein 2 n=1 Tax=Calliphora vicina TaxID=7373 RepID=UPI00325AE619
MCSIGEDDFGDEGGVHAMIPDIKTYKVTNLIEEQLCNKCKKPGAGYKLPFRQAECRECFLLYARHKFRAALGSSKVLPKDAKVVLVFDGSAESLVLLDMLHHAQTQNAFKRLHCNATVLYIDDYQLLEQSSERKDEYVRFLEKMQIFLQEYIHFESYIVPLVEEQQVISCMLNFKTIKDQQYHLQHEDKKQSFLSSINSIKSLTSRQDFVKHHRSKLIAAVAKHFESKFAFMADISSDLASDLLAAVALGRGGSAALDVALVDDRLGDDIKLIRPLKDLNIAEIELYLKAQDLQLLQTKRYGVEVGSTASLQNLTKSFVDNLQQNFSATVSTVFRTGDKIAVNQDVIQRLDELDLNNEDNLKTDDKCCSFCKSFLDYQDSTTLLAIEFSRLVSESGCTLDKCPDLNSKATENVGGSVEKPYLKKLCHACRNICMESANESLLL